MRIATLTIVTTSPTCRAYRLLDHSGKVVWRNRVEPSSRGDAGARQRMAAWAKAHGYVVKEVVPALSGARRAGRKAAWQGGRGTTRSQENVSRSILHDNQR